MTALPMREAQRPEQGSDENLVDALHLLEAAVMDGLRHGYFELHVRSEVVKNQRRRMVIEMGKSFQFTITPDELT